MDRIEIPPRLRGRPANKAGYIVPWFVGDDPDGDFRIIDTGRIVEAVRSELCFLCGQRRGRFATFAVGPMCTVNQVSAEPPMHRDCALYAVQVCPFLTRPNMVRRETGIKERVDVGELGVSGQMIDRNPGVIAVWTTRDWAPFAVPEEAGGGVLFNIGDEPTEVTWWTEGREAGCDEVLDSMIDGLPVLVDAAKQGGALAVVQLGNMLVRSLRHLPEGLPRDDMLAELTVRMKEQISG